SGCRPFGTRSFVHAYPALPRRAFTFRPLRGFLLRDMSVRVHMSLPVIAVTNASTCLKDAQVEAVLPALQNLLGAGLRAYISWKGRRADERVVADCVER